MLDIHLPLRSIILVVASVACAHAVNLYGVEVAESISFYVTEGEPNATGYGSTRNSRDAANCRNRQDVVGPNAYTYIDFLTPDLANSSQVIPRHVTIQWNKTAVPRGGFPSLVPGKYTKSDIYYCSYVDSPPATRAEWAFDFQWWLGGSTPFPTAGWSGASRMLSRSDTQCPSDDISSDCKHVEEYSANICSVTKGLTYTKLYFSKSTTSSRYLPNTALHKETDLGDHLACDLNRGYAEYYHKVTESSLSSSSIEDFVRPLLPVCEKIGQI